MTKKISSSEIFDSDMMASFRGRGIVRRRACTLGGVRPVLPAGPAVVAPAPDRRVEGERLVQVVCLAGPQAGGGLVW